MNRYRPDEDEDKWILVDQIRQELAAVENEDEQDPFCPHCDAGMGLCSGPHKGTDEIPY